MLVDTSAPVPGKVTNQGVEDDGWRGACGKLQCNL
jgi:hypothetical protein